MRNSGRFGKFYLWGAPLTGALLTATFLVIRMSWSDDVGGNFVPAFATWFLVRLVIGYALALPLLLLAHRLGVRNIGGFAAISALAAVPYEWYVSNPMNAWHPTEAQVDHGIYWASFIVSIILASSTGICFSRGALPTKRA
jgi:hypothetical protein